MHEEAKSIRAFLAIDPPEDVLKAIAGIQNRLRKTIEGAVQWVRPQGIHLTLKFFGDISEIDASALAGPVRERAAASEPIALQVGNIGIFPDLRRPRVIWLGVNGDVQRLILLQRDLEEALARCGFPKESRPFRPHLTLGRIKSPKGLLGLARAIEKAADYQAGHFHAEELILFKSDLTPQGAIYTPWEKFPFKERKR